MPSKGEMFISVLFQSWAKHRGRLGAEQVDYNKLKGNFRSVLHKSEDFKELKDRSKTDQQSGNYRVFQILPSSAVKGSIFALFCCVKKFSVVLLRQNIQLEIKTA